ncbi:MAG TPA: hypothetical protein VFI17_05025 [Solirubrobacterales bacterium]|nr:hypothetical protein [Solirubrobacterales bacterium]
MASTGRAGQRRGDLGGDAVGFAVELSVRVAEDGEALVAEVEVAGVVGLEGDRTLVVGEEVGFDDKARLAPEEVNLPAADLDVRLWEREIVAAPEFVKASSRSLRERRGSTPARWTPFISAWRLARRRRWGGKGDLAAARSSMVRWIVVTGIRWRFVVSRPPRPPSCCE